jgi:hypothetical protein
MKIALDWDDTVTRDPEFWGSFIRLSRKSGHEVRIVTFRSTGHTEDIRYTLEILGCEDIKIHTTNGVQKREFTNQIGWLPHVWIDDSPEFIVCDTSKE